MIEPVKLVLKYIVWFFLLGESYLGISQNYGENGEKELNPSCCSYSNFDGSYNRYIDVSINCLNLSSIANVKEEITRIWRVNQLYDDTCYLEIILFEFGKRYNKNIFEPFAKIYQLKWQKVQQDSIAFNGVIVNNLYSKDNFEGFEKLIKKNNFEEMQKMDFPVPLPLSMGHNMLIFQNLKGEFVQTINFSNRPSFIDPISKRDKLFFNLVLNLGNFFYVDLLGILKMQ